MLRAARALRGRWAWAACSRKKNAVDGLQPPADSVFRPRRSRLSSAQGWKCAVTTLDTEIDTVLLDCDGVLWNGDTVIDGAREALASCGGQAAALHHQQLHEVARDGRRKVSQA